MKSTLFRLDSLILFGLPLALILAMVLLVQSPVFQAYPQELSIGITLDLILSLPLVYFLLIRKKEISKLSVVSIFVAGMLIASFILLPEHQSLLNLVKTWVFPIVEISVVSFLLFKVRQTIKAYKMHRGDNPDFYSTLLQASGEILPGRVATLMTTEIATLYYCFAAWKKRPLGPNEFAYHKKSGIRMVLCVFIALAFMETAVVHLLVERWSVVAAYILSFISLYSCLQIFGLLKAMPRRPIDLQLAENKLVLRYGFLSESIIPLAAIERIELTSRALPEKEENTTLSPLGILDTHNTVLYLNDPQVLNGLYGIKTSYTTIALYVDEKETFKKTLETIISERACDD